MRSNKSKLLVQDNRLLIGSFKLSDTAAMPVHKLMTFFSQSLLQKLCDGKQRRCKNLKFRKKRARNEQINVMSQHK